MKRIATAVWNGSGKEGAGIISSTSKVLDNTPYSFAARFLSEEGKAGTNPEELIAAAHAACFNMALSFQLGGAGYTPDSLHTRAVLSMENVDGHFKIMGIELQLSATIEGISKEKFEEIAMNAKQHCPVSQALAAVAITLSTQLNS